MKEKKILLNYLIYLLIGLLICFVGITGVFADTTIDTSQFINTTGRKWSDGLLEYSNNPSYNTDWLLNAYNVTGGIYTPPNSYDYIQFSYFEHNTSQFNPCNSTSKFTAEFNLLFTSATFNQYVSSVKWGNDSCSIQERNQDGTMKISCVASPSSSNFTGIYVNYNDIQGTSTSSLYISRNIGITCGLNTDAIINNDNANTQNIINNNNNNTQQIIDSSASNTQAIIDSNKVCNFIDKNTILENNKQLGGNGTIYDANNYGITDFIEISSNMELEETSNFDTAGSSAFCFYNSSKERISCIQNGQQPVGKITIPNNASYVRFSIYIPSNRPTFKICQNGQQANNETSKGILGKIKELFSWFNNDDDADVSGLNNMVGWLPPGPVDSIINLPLAFFNALTNTLTGTCQDVSIPIPFVNQNLTLPCFDSYMSQYLTGFSTLWTLVGSILSIFILYYYLLALYKWVDDTLTFRENNLPGYYDDNWGGGA